MLMTNSYVLSGNTLVVPVLAQRGTQGGDALFGAPWWVGLIGIFMAFLALWLARAWWTYRMTRSIKKEQRHSRRRIQERDRS